jgi:Ca2+-binding RTX toxin-like protein
MNSRLPRIVLTLALSIVGALSLAAVAQAAAGTVTVYDGGDHKQIRYQGTTDANHVTLGGDAAAHAVTISETGIADPGAGDDPGNICALTSADTLTCTDPKLGVGGWQGGYAYLAAGNDVSITTGTQRWDVWGAEGEDSLTGGDEVEDYLKGGPDNDTVEGRGSSGRLYYADDLSGDEGNDIVRGGAGDDYLDGGTGTDELDGGDGQDWIYGDAGVDTLRGGAGSDGLGSGPGDGERSEAGDGSDWIECEGDSNETYDGGSGFDSIDCDGGIENGNSFDPDDYVVDLDGAVVRRTNHVPTVSTLTSIEDAETGDGNDVVIGTAGANSLYAGRGNDSVDGRGGSDYIRADFGDDTIEAADGAPDRVDAGDGADNCHADTLDEQFGCEGLSVAPVPTSSGSAGDRTAPTCRITSASGNRAKGRIAARVTCDEGARLGVEAVGRLRRLTRGALASGVGDVTLGTASARAAANVSVRVTVRVSRRYRRALPKGGRIRLTLRAADALGNRSVITRRVRMR